MNSNIPTSNSEHVRHTPGVPSAAGNEGQKAGDIPVWMLQPLDYQPPKDRDKFINQSILSLASVLAHFRLDDGVEARFSPSAPVKMIFGLGCILLTSLSTNFAFTLTVLAGVLVRLCLLPAKKLRRAVGIALGALALSLLIMLPSVLLGQGHSIVLIPTKVFVCVSIAMCVALSTPFNQLTAALRVFHVPNLFVMTLDLALKNIVSLGRTALEVLTALRLRSVGRNRNKGTSIGGVAGVVFLKSNDAAKDTFDAMTCRGFDCKYNPPAQRSWRVVDLAWLALLAALIALFVYLQGAI